jgi:hypothetical protein
MPVAQSEVAAPFSGRQGNPFRNRADGNDTVGEERNRRPRPPLGEGPLDSPLVLESGEWPGYLNLPATGAEERHRGEPRRAP